MDSNRGFPADSTSPPQVTNAKKKRRTNAGSNRSTTASTSAVSAMENFTNNFIPPPASGFSDTLFANNPFDDEPKSQGTNFRIPGRSPQMPSPTSYQTDNDINQMRNMNPMQPSSGMQPMQSGGNMNPMQRSSGMNPMQSGGNMNPMQLSGNMNPMQPSNSMNQMQPSNNMNQMQPSNSMNQMQSSNMNPMQPSNMNPMQPNSRMNSTMTRMSNPSIGNPINSMKFQTPSLGNMNMISSDHTKTSQNPMGTVNHMNMNISHNTGNAMNDLAMNSSSIGGPSFNSSQMNDVINSINNYLNDGRGSPGSNIGHNLANLLRAPLGSNDRFNMSSNPPPYHPHQMNSIRGPSNRPQPPPNITLPRMNPIFPREMSKAPSYINYRPPLPYTNKDLASNRNQYLISPSNNAPRSVNLLAELEMNLSMPTMLPGLENQACSRPRNMQPGLEDQTSSRFRNMQSELENQACSKSMRANQAAERAYEVNQAIIFNHRMRQVPPVEPCKNCAEIINSNDKAIFCEVGCKRWYHMHCSGLTVEAYQMLMHEVFAEWICNTCHATKNIPPVIVQT